jgi:hypothetical protein
MAPAVAMDGDGAEEDFRARDIVQQEALEVGGRRGIDPGGDFAAGEASAVSELPALLVVVGEIAEPFAGNEEEPVVGIVLVEDFAADEGGGQPDDGERQDRPDVEGESEAHCERIGLPGCVVQWNFRHRYRVILLFYSAMRE